MKIEVENEHRDVLWIERQQNEDKRVQGDDVANESRDGKTSEMAFEPVE
jgi:hypothetical protein